MKKIAPLLLLALGTLLAVTLIFLPHQANASDRALRAQVNLQGAPDSGISGHVLFIQTREGILPTVQIIAEVTGLPPNTLHGFHIHENGTCEPSFAAAGGHYDPGPNGNSDPDANHPFHMGDLPNLRANDQGIAKVKHTTSRITLSAGPLSLFDDNGSAIIVHANEDRGTTGVTGGAGGSRIACGVVEANG
ncbi:superoxide dismutase family protein [Stenomitos frigidus]|uniref:Superoxide dismutase n=1 Tax=Stenomitos frigidus ULC18 TaxID=2107698 RepID=A0A2T1ECS4_9CYAN|nr:superoxide dismutase family protein [Stenomitos frigidus]PSB30530.1 superoxide dismutase [Stenomitos frigidus ULC18]